MAKIDKIICDACGKDITVDDVDHDIVGIEIYSKCNKEVEELFGEERVKDLCDDCALMLARYFADLKNKTKLQKR